MPNLVAAEWEKAGDLPAIRRAIYVGHESEMPSWGLVGLKYRDIDAVAHYIDDLLRASE
jgi:mono/diheme cytochrome c family protein